MKPNIKVGERVAHNFLQNRLEFKILNRGRTQVTDIQVQVNFLRRTESGRDSRTIMGNKIKIVNPVFSSLGPFMDLRSRWRLPSATGYIIENADHWIRLLEEDKADQCRLALTITATHAYSGRKTVQHKVFVRKDIQEGHWEVGLAFEPEAKTRPTS